MGKQQGESKKKRFEALLEALQTIESEIDKNKPLRLEVDLYINKIKLRKTEFVTVEF